MSQTSVSPPAYFRAFSNHGTIVCTEHRLGYTPENLLNHLVHAHKVKGEQKKATERWLKQLNFCGPVTEPAHYSAPISGLEVLTGWQCNVCHTTKLSQSLQVIERHCSQHHQLDSKRKRKERGAISQVSLQRWFAKSNKYWIIDPGQISTPTTTTTTTSPTTPSQHGSPHGSHSTIRRSSVASSRFFASASNENILRQLSQTIAAEDHAHRQRLTAVEHIAELSPWLRLCRFHEHLIDIDLKLVALSYPVPRKVEEHPQLFYLGQSVERVFETAYKRVNTLHHVDAKRLNSFQPGLISQDPFDRLQEQQSFQKYVHTSARLICYVYRVTQEDHFDQEMFHFTQTQQSTFGQVCRAVEARIEYVSVASNGTATASGEDHDDEPTRTRLEGDLDQWILAFYVALIQHRTKETGFQSAVISFCAVLSRNPTTGEWLSENQCASMLSQLIYCCQLVVLAESHRLCAEGQHDDVSDALEVLCSQWLWNTSKGPVSDMLRLRLYAMKVAQNTVHPAQIRWRSDGETLMYRDLTYRISDLSTELTFYLKQAQLIFSRDLCFGLDDIPTFQLHELEDNWDARRGGDSFLTDVRNAAQFEGYDHWLIDQISAHSDLYELVVQCSGDSDTVGDQVKSTFAREFEESIQRFLLYMFLLLYIFSGQPGRLKEMLCLLYQNKAMTVRHLFAHDGFILFLLTYHKALHRTHASRFPVRVLFPEVGQLLVQYFVLILPMRRLFSRAVGIPTTISEYLWHDGDNIWTAKKVTDFARTASQSAIGVAVSPQARRQIAVAIAVKKFGGLEYQADLDLAGDDDDDLGGKSILEGWGGAMANVFHLQASHSAFTGNRIYGGTVNFEGGLTDAGLQEYLRASRLWHQLCRPQSVSSLAGHRRQASSRLSQSANTPLRKRLALREQPPRHRLRWGSDQVQFALRQLFPGASSGTFRSPHQEQLIESIVRGCPEVVGVLATGEGKSCAFLLPACLPQAGMTVVVVPLVALKSDMVRRCAEAGIRFGVWDSGQNSQQCMGTPLVFVSVEQAVRSRFRAFLGQLDATGGLDRVVFDEAHLILTASQYRPKMALIRQLRSLFCQVVFLTATLPPIMQAQFEARMLLKNPRVVRSQTFRQDIVLRLRHSRDLDVTAYIGQIVTSLLESYRLDAEARIIVYTVTRADADQLSDRLMCPKYYSDSGDAAQKQEAMQQWRTGVSKVMVATSAFGMGIDFPSVRQVIHMGVPRDMIGFAQEIGRLSRDGQGGFSRVILPKGWQSPGLPSVHDQRRSAVSEMAMSVYLHANRCLSAVMSRFLDGAERMQYCLASRPQMRCSKCEQFGLFQTGEESDHTAWWDPDPAGIPADSSAEEGDDGVVSEREGDLNVGGSERLRDSMREEAMCRDRFEERLQMFRGRCMICMILGRRQILPDQQWHSLDRCRHIQRRQFFQAKQRAIERNQCRGGWMKAYIACFRCGLPQQMCPVDDTPPDGRCQYRDMVFPAAWALFHCENRWGRSIGMISGTVSRVWEHEDRWMDWLGTECELWGLRACQAVRMLDEIMSLESGEGSNRGADGRQVD